MDFSEAFLENVSVNGVLILLIVAVAALCIYLWHRREAQAERTFTVTREGLNQQSGRISELLASMKLSKSEITNTLLLLEELIIRFEEQAGQTVTARVEKVFGDVQLLVTALGDAYNPFEDLSSWADESEDAYRDLIFRANKEKLAYARRGRKNCITVLAHSASSRTMYYTFAAMFAGIAVGFVLKFIPLPQVQTTAETVLNMAQTLFMNALMLILAPVLFLSLVNSFSSLSSGREIGRLSGKVLGIFLTTTVLTVIISFLLTYLFFRTGVPHLPETFLESSKIESKPVGENISIVGIIVGIIPRNIINPITDLNMLQIIFVSIFFGVALSSLGDKTAHIRMIFSEIYEVFLKMVNMVISFMPLVAFSAMALLIVTSKAESLVVLLKLLLLIIVGFIVLIVLNSFLIFAVGRVSPIPYLRKIPSYLVNPFMLASSTGCIPITMDFCTKKLGVSKKISAFTVPIGATLNMCGTALFLSSILILLGKMCGVEFTTSQLIKHGMLIVLFSAGCAGVPNAGVITTALLLSSAGIPVGSIGFILGIFNLIDRIATCANVNGDVATAVIVGSSEKELDKAVYHS